MEERGSIDATTINSHCSGVVNCLHAFFQAFRVLTCASMDVTEIEIVVVQENCETVCQDSFS